MPLKERFKDVPTPEREFRVTIGREMEHFRYVLEGIASGKDARTEEEMEQAWILLGQWNHMTDVERGESINRLTLEHEYPVVTRRGITIAAVRDAFRRVDRDAPAEIVRRLKGPFSLEDMVSLRDYAIEQQLTTRASIDNDWRALAFKGDNDKVTLKRVYASFLASAHLPEWQRKAQKRLDTTRKPQSLRQSTPNADSVSTDRQPSGKPHRKSTLF